MYRICPGTLDSGAFFVEIPEKRKNDIVARVRNSEKYMIILCKKTGDYQLFPAIKILIDLFM